MYGTAIINTEGTETDRLVKIITIAPDVPGALPVMEELADRGWTVSLGHTSVSCCKPILYADRVQ